MLSSRKYHISEIKFNEEESMKFMMGMDIIVWEEREGEMLKWSLLFILFILLFVCSMAKNVIITYGTLIIGRHFFSQCFALTSNRLENYSRTNDIDFIDRECCAVTLALTYSIHPFQSFIIVK